MTAIVQTAKYEPGSSGTSVDFTLGSAPTDGNVLIACCAYSQAVSARTIGTPAGWTKVLDVTGSGGGSNGNDSLAVFWKVASGGGTTYSFSISGTADFRSGVIYELSGADTSNPFDSVQSFAGNADNNTCHAAGDATSEFAIALFCTDVGSGATPGATTSDLVEGWTGRQLARPPFHALYAYDRVVDDSSHQYALIRRQQSVVTALSAMLIIAGTTSHPRTSPTIQQTAQCAPVAAGTSIPFTLAAAPGSGILLAVCCYSQAVSARTIGTPAGWTKIADFTSGNDSMAIFWRLSSGAGTTHTFTVTPANDWVSGVLYEIAGVDTTTPIDQTITGTGTAAITGTPAGNSELVIAAFGEDAGGGVDPASSTVSAGWYIDRGAHPNAGAGFHACLTAHKSVETATALSVSPTWPTGTNAVSALVMLKPAAASSSIKTIEGLAIANVKTTMGVTIANLKSFEGLV